MKNKIVVISFILAFFTIHPVNQMCSENCLAGALAIATSFSFLNLQIYKFFMKESFDVALPVQPIIKAYFDCENDTEKMSRIFHTIFNIFMNIVFIVFAMKISWIFQ
jgi:hypothetical protein